jgi:hypothetical protein
MKTFRYPFVWLFYPVFWCAAVLSACVSTPQVLTIPSAAHIGKPPQHGTRDYASVLAAITAVMVRDLKLPPIDGGSVTIYYSQASFEAGAVAQSAEILEMAQKQYRLNADQVKELESSVTANSLRMATGSAAMGMYKKVLLNDWRLAKYPWAEWVRILAHELTHTANKEQAGGKLAVPYQWLSEGFAEWVGYKVVDTLGAQELSVSRNSALGVIGTAMSYQTFPRLHQLAKNPDWITWARTLGLPATYGQAFMAVDFLVQEKGLSAVVEYFGFFKTLNNTDRNFMKAFGEPLSAFDDRFSHHLRNLLGK